MKTELESIVVEYLGDSDFIPGIHEAYAFCCEDLPTHRLGGFFLRQLNSLDWDNIEAILDEI
jgi:hypothetical protein